MLFVDLDFGNLLAILEENGVNLPEADDYNVLEIDEANNKATFEILLEGSITKNFMFTLHRRDDEFFVRF